MYKRPGIQPGPSINICPSCHSPKIPNQALCTTCNTRSCTNGHILSGTERICSRCSWIDPQMKPPSTLYSSSRATTKPEIVSSKGLCPICKNRINPDITQCPYCGNLVSSEYDQFPVPHAYPQMPPTNAPLQKESVVVFQESVGHRDTKRTYICPNCHNKMEDPSSGQCPFCGYVGTMQYDITRKQPQWTAPQKAAQPPQVPRQQIHAQQNPPLVTQPVKETPRSAGGNNCPGCGTPNPRDTRFCRSCGYRYGTGRMSQKIMTKSTAERSYAAAAASPEIYAPIYGDEPEDEIYKEAPVLPRKGKSAPGAKKIRVKTRGQEGEKKFPLALLMAIMIVAAMIIGMGIFVISRESRTPVRTDSVPPKISEVSFATATDGSIIIKWLTDEPSTSQVMMCDPSGLCTWTDPDTTLVKNHSVTASNIKYDLKYHVTVKSIDQHGNEAQFESDQTFNNNASADSIPPKISEVTISDITDVSVLVKWRTDEPATGKVDYGTTQSYGTSTSIDMVLTTNHLVHITGLSPDTAYYFRVNSQDAAGNAVKDDTAQSQKTLIAVPLGIKVGNRALDFTLNNLSGTPVQLSSFRGKKIVIVNFWATWCGPCVAEMPYFQSVKTNWANSAKLEILAVNIQENTTAIQSFLQNKGYTFTVLLDPGTVKTMYSVSMLPTTFIIDTQGIIREIHPAFSSQTEIESFLNAIY